MAPKIQAIIEYLEGGGHEALITDPTNVERALAGGTGTRFTLSSETAQRRAARCTASMIFW